MQLSSIPKKMRIPLLMLVLVVLSIPIGLYALRLYQNYKGRAATGAAVLTFSPTSQTSAVGSTGTFNVFLNPNGELVNGLELWISYDPTKINVTNIVPGPFFNNSSGSPQEIVKSASNGQIHYAVAFPLVLGTALSSSTANTAAVIQYTAVAAGTSNFTFLTTSPNQTIVSNINAVNVLASVTNGAIVVTGPTASPSPTGLRTPSPSPTRSPSPSPTRSPSPSPTRSPSPTPTRSPSPSPTRSPSPTPTRSPSPTPTRSPSPTPTRTPTPTALRTPSPTASTVARLGDVNGDGIINIVDIGIVIDNYNKLPITVPSADINHDGSVDIIDIGIIVDHYGQ